MMPDITFTQYIPPNGKKETVTIDRPQHIFDKAEKIREAGFHFEAEVLTAGQVSLTIGDDDGDWAYEIIPNDPNVAQGVDRLIMNFDLDKEIEAKKERS